jgi:spore coat assembly protein
MMWMKQGDYVARISYGRDVVFRIEEIIGATAILRGVEYRLLADAPLTDLEIVGDPFTPPDSRHRDALEHLRNFKRQASERIRQIASQFMAGPGSGDEADHYFEVPGKVLHLDGDAAYLRKSLELYGELRVPVEGYYVHEARMPEALYRLLPKVNPNIVVITGHDGMYKTKREETPYALENYKNSGNFVEAVKIARQFERNMDALIIIAGACQSHFEALLQAGANFASSPGRILIHALDPVQIAAKIAYTSMRDTVRMREMVEHTISGIRGIGGIETRGCYRVGVPGFRKLSNY